MIPAILCVIIATVALLGPTACACLNSTDSFAAEVFLNKPGGVVHLELFEDAENVAPYGTSLLYRSHADARVAVILDYQVDVVLWSDRKGVSGLDVRLQIPTKEADGSEAETITLDDGADIRANDALLVSAVDIDPETFDFQAAMRMELDWLWRSGVIGGFEAIDVEVIAGLSGRGVAGWNGRVVYDVDGWTPYPESSGLALIRDGIDCSVFGVGLAPSGDVSLRATGVDPVGTAATMWGALRDLP